MSDQNTPQPGKRVRKMRRRIVVIAAASIFLLLVLAVILAPAIGGSLAPGLVRDALSQSINGRVSVGRVSLSWFGTQTAGPITIEDDAGKPVAKVNLEASRGLFSLARGALGLGPMDVGSIRVTGEATVIRHADGTTNLERLIKPTAPTATGQPSSGGGSDGLPRGLAGQFKLESFNLTLVDEDGPKRMDVAGLTATASYADGSARIKVSAPATLTQAGKTSPAGTLLIDATVKGLADSRGRLTPEAAVIDAAIDGSDISTHAAGIFTGLGDKLVSGLGKTIKVSAKVKGSVSSGEANVVVASRGLNADIGLKASDGVLTNSRPGSVQVSGEVLRAFTGEYEDKLENVKLARAPDVTLSLDSLHVPHKNGAIDVESIAALISLKTTAMSATLALPDQPERRLDVAPLEAVIDARDLAAATMKASTSFELDSTPAGSLIVDLRAAKPFKSGMPALFGKAALNDLSTSAAQPFVESLGLDLPAGIGPTLAMTLDAAQSTQGRTEVDVRIRSAGLNGAALAAYEGDTLELREPAEFSLRSPRTLAAKALESSGVRVSDGGFAKISIKTLSFRTGGTILDSLNTDAVASFGGLSIMPEAVESEPLSINQVIVGARLDAGGQPRIDLKASGAHAGGDFFAQGQFELSGLLSAAGENSKARELTPARARPVGALRINNIPTSLVAWSGQNAEVVKLVRDGVGPAVTLVMDAARAGEGTGVTLNATAANLNGRFSAEIADNAVKISECDFRTSVNPDLMSALLDIVGPTLEQKPTLVGTASVVAHVDPLTVPIGNGTVKAAEAGDAKFKVGFEGTVQVTNLTVIDESGQQRDLGAFGLQDIMIKGSAPIASFAGAKGPRPAEVTISGAILGDAGAKIAGINGSAKAQIDCGSPVGDLTASLVLAVQNSGKLDSILNQPGMVSGAVGEKLDVNASAAMRFTKGQNQVTTLESGTLDVSVSSPRIATDRPLKAVAKADRVSVDSAMVLTWNADATWLNRYMLDSQRSNAAQVRITRSSPVTVKLLKLNVGLAGSELLMKPGQFLADAEVSAPEVTIASGSTESTIKNFTVRAAGGREPGVIGFSIRADDLGSGPGPNAAQALVLQGGIYKVADSEGHLTPESAVISLTGDAHGAPTALLDSLANQGGWLPEALGPMVTVNVRTEGVNKGQGKVFIQAHSPRADAELTGSFSSGTFIADGEPKVTLHSVTPEFGAMLVDGLPLLGVFEKRPEDGPAQVSVQGLRLPLDGKVEHLNGEFRVDLGQARFEASRVFGTLLKLAKQRESAMIGRRIEPLTVSIQNGVISYPRFKVPLGEFSVDARGTIDLVNRKLDVVTYVPFGAMADEAAGRLNTGLGRLLTGAIPVIEQATMVPIRTSGSIADPKTEIDVEMFVKETGQALLRPDRIIKDGLDRLLNRDKEKK